MVHPLYNYGLPVLNSGQPAGGTPAVTTGEVEQGSLGSPHTPPANSGSSWGSSGAPSEELVAMYTPVLTSINPTTAVVGGADLTLTATGTGFRPGTGPGPTSIYFNNSQEPTTYVSATSVTTGVKPSTASGAATVPVHVANAGVKSAPQDFTFTAAE